MLGKYTDHVGSIRGLAQHQPGIGGMIALSRGVVIVDGTTVTVATVASRTEAELIVGLLRNNGLRAAVAADDAGGQEPQLQLEGVRVLVAPADEAAARQLLAAAERDHD